jgi:hypothetical protein
MLLCVSEISPYFLDIIIELMNKEERWDLDSGLPPHSWNLDEQTDFKGTVPRD